MKIKQSRFAISVIVCSLFCFSYGIDEEEEEVPVPPPPALPFESPSKKPVMQEKIALSEAQLDQLLIDEVRAVAQQVFPGKAAHYVNEITRAFKRLHKKYGGKKREVFDSLQKDLTLFVDMLKKEASSDKTEKFTLLYKNFEDVTGIAGFTELRNIFGNCAFDKNAFAQVITDDIAVIFANIIVGLRVPEDEKNITMDDKIQSDELAAQIFDRFIAQKQSIEQLTREINRLRVHPKFLKFAGLLGADQIAHAKSLSPILQAKAMPLLHVLRDPNADKKEFVPSKNFLLKVGYQLFFNPDDFFELKPGNTVLENAINKHIAYLTSKQKGFDIGTFLNERFANVKDIDAVQRVMRDLARKPLSKEKRTLANQLKNDITSVQLVADQFLKNLKMLSDLDFSAQLGPILKEHQGKMANAKKILDTLKQAKKRYQKKNAYQGKFLYQALSDIEGSDVFKDLFRTPDLVRAFVKKYVKGQELEHVATSDDFFRWIHPYGLLLKVLSEVPAKENIHEDLLFSLRALDSGKIRQEDTDDYVPAVIAERDVVTSGAYKNKLRTGIGYFDALELRQAKDFIDAFVAAAGMDVQNTDQYKNIMQNLMRALAEEQYKKTTQALKSLDAGTATIPGLKLVGVGRAQISRNRKLYKKMQGLFGSLVASVEKHSKLDTVIAAFLDKFQFVLKDLDFSEEDKKEVAKKMAAYLQSLKSHLIELKQYIL